MSDKKVAEEPAAVEGDDEILDPHGAALLLGLCRDMVVRHAKAGKIPGFKLGGTRWRFSRRQLIKHIEAGEQA